MTRFRRSGRQILITMADYEEAVLESMVEQLISLLEGEPVRHAVLDPFARWEAELGPAMLDTSDPVIARLFPPAYVGDDAAEAEFRRFTESSQRQAKIEQAQLVLAALQESNAAKDPVLVRPQEVEGWLKTLVAIRLSLSVRLGIERAEDVDDLEELDEDDPRAVLYQMYEWLGYFLEGLLSAQH